jgi:hypothetical protein
MRRASRILLAAGNCVVALFLFLKYVYNPVWDGTLMGPYPGRPYEGDLPKGPAAFFAVDSVRLEVYETAGTNNPILVIRSERGDVLSRALLVPERRNGERDVIAATVRDLRMHKRKLYSCHGLGGPIILITCDWEWGGREGGLLCLKDDLSFGEMWLSW